MALDQIRAAEHRFCEAVDLKVNPDTFNGDSCFDCVIGQLIIADHLLRVAEHRGVFTTAIRKIFLVPGAPTWEEWCETREVSPNDLDRQREWQYEVEAEDDIILGVVAEHYGVDQEKLSAVYYGVTSERLGYEVASDLELAKRYVVDAYFGCDED